MAMMVLLVTILLTMVAGAEAVAQMQMLVRLLLIQVALVALESYFQILLLGELTLVT
jgi:hypothetical protein